MHEKLFQKLEIAKNRYEILHSEVTNILSEIAHSINYATYEGPLKMWYSQWEYNWEKKTYTVYSTFRGEREHNYEITFPESIVFNPDQIQPYIDNLIKEKAQKEIDLKAIRKQHLLKELEKL